MGEAKRREQAAMSVTVEHRRMAARIDAKMKQLDALGMLEVQIIPAMAEYMSDFHHLIVSTFGHGSTH
jgi:hypothetical protein